MKTLIFIKKTTFLFSGLLLMSACQNAKLDKSTPPPTPAPPAGQQFPPSGPPPGAGSGYPPHPMPPQQQQPVVYPPPVTRVYPRQPINDIPARPPREREDNSRVGTAPVNPPRQKGTNTPPRQEPQIIPWFEKAGPYEKVVENCGKDCPPKPPCTKPDCNVETKVDTTPVPTPPVVVTPRPPVLKEGEVPRDVECPPVDLRKREVVQDLDVVFVVDNSDSMLVERQKVARGMSLFAQHLGLDKNLRVAVVPANGPKGSGFAQVVGQVIDVTELKKTHGAENAVAQMSAQLEHWMSNMPKDASDAQGEVGMTATYYLVRDHLSQAKQMGLFRDKAGVLLVYISDENDVCYDYEANGTRPNYVYPGQDNGAQGAPGDGIGRDPFEARTFMANGVCKNVGPRGESISPKLVYEAVKDIKGDQPVMMSGILYLREGHIPEAQGPYKYEKEKGRGYLDMISLAQGKAYELSDSNFGKHLADMANTARVRLEYETVLTMKLEKPEDDAKIDPMSIRVVVKNAQGTVLKEFQTRCSVAGAQCPANIGAATFIREDDGHGKIVPRVSISPEVAKNLESGAKAYIYYRTK